MQNVTLQLLFSLTFAPLTGAATAAAPIQSASEYDYPPFSVITQDRQADGFSVELLRAALHAVGLEVQFKIGPWHEIKQDLAERRLQVLPLFARSEEREKSFDFTAPYLYLHGAIVRRKGDARIRRMEDLRGKTVVVMQGDIAEEYVRDRHLSDQVITTVTTEQGLKQLAAGQHDAMVVEKLAGESLIRSLGLANLETVGPPLENYQDFCFAVHKGDKELLALLNEGLALVVADGTLERLREKWIAPTHAEHLTHLRHVLTDVLGTLLLAVLAAYLWQRALRRQVRMRTLALSITVVQRDEEIRLRRQAEARLKESEERYRVISSIGLNFMFSCRRRTDGLFRIDWLAGAAAPIFGVDNDTLIAQGCWRCFVVPEDIECFDANITALRPGEIRDFELRILAADGAIHDLRCYVQLTIDPVDETRQRVHGGLQDITERKQAEQRLRESEQKFSRIFKHMPIPLGIATQDGGIESFNDCFTQVFGYTIEDLPTLDVWWQRIYPDASYRQWAMERWSAAAAKAEQEGTEIQPAEYRVTCKDGAERTVLIGGTSLEGRVLATFVDLTARKQVEKALFRANERLACINRVQRLFIGAEMPPNLFDALLIDILTLTESPFGFVNELMTDAKGQRYQQALAISNIAWDEATRRFYDQHAPGGFRFDRFDCLNGAAIVSGQPVIANDPAHDPRGCGQLPPGHPPLNAFLGLPLRQGETLIGSIGLANREGGYDQALVDYLQPILDATAQVIEAYRNERRRRAIEAQLRDSERRFRVLFEQAALGVALLRSDSGQFVTINQKYCDIVGYSRDELEQIDFQTITHPEDLPADLANMELLKVGAFREYAMEKRYIRKDGSIIWVRLTVSPMWSPGEPPDFHIAVVEDITARRRAETQSQRFGQLLQSSFNEIYLFDAETLRFVQASEGAYKNIGYSAEELEQLTPLELKTEFTRKTFETLLAPLRWGEQELISFESRHRRKDGSTYPVEVRIQLMEANPPVFLSIIQDISQRKGMEQTIRESNTLLDSIINNIPHVIFLKRAEDLRFVLFNRAGLAFMGHDREALIGHNDYDFFPKEQADFFTQKDREVFQRADVLDIPEESIETPHGPRILHTQKLTLRDEHGQPQYLLGISEDITERKQTEAELDRYRHHLEALVEERTDSLQKAHRTLRDTQFAMDSVGIGIEWVDADTGRFLYVNQASADMLGYPVDELLRLGVPDIDPGFSQEAFRQATEALRRQGHAQFETRHRAQDGCIFPVEVTTHYLDTDGPMAARFISFVTDIRKRKDAEQALVAAKEAAEAANRAKSVFLANMSHEIRTPMNGILGMAHLLRRGDLPPKQADWVDKIETSGKHLLGLLNDILDLAKIEADKLVLEHKDFQLAELIRSLIAITGDTMRAKGLQFFVKIPGVPQALNGDPTRLSQALMNYLGNAIKFTGQSGSITLKGRLLEETAAGYLLRFEIIDTGIGMTPEQIARIFQPFQQADGSTTRQYGGTGLGLAITRQLVHRMGGETGVDSTLGQGSSFWLTVRMGKGGAVPSPSPRPGGSGLQPRNPIGGSGLQPRNPIGGSGVPPRDSLDPAEATLQREHRASGCWWRKMTRSTRRWHCCCCAILV